jgi:hypothetical protein
MVGREFGYEFPTSQDGRLEQSNTRTSTHVNQDCGPGIIGIVIDFHMG